MKIRAKVCNTLIALFIMSLLLVSLVGRQAIVHETLKLQRHFVTDTGTFAEGLINSRVQWLDDYVRDMSYWNETYDLMRSDRDTAQSYFDEDLPDSSLGMDALLFFREDGTLFSAQMLEDDGSDPALLAELQAFFQEDLSQERGDARRDISGLLNLPSGPTMVATSRILTTDGEGPSRGTLVLAQRFGEEENAGIKRLAGRELDLIPPVEARLNSALQPLTGPGEEPWIAGKGQDSRGYALIRDMKGEPALLLSMPFPQELLTRPLGKVLLWGLGMASAFMLLLTATFLLLQKVVLRRLAEMTKSMERLTLSPDSQERLPLDGDDEIADVSRHFNGLMDSMMGARNRLQQSEFRYRTIFERSPISLWEEDFSAIREHLDRLRSEGVEDLAPYLEEHPEETLAISALPRVLDINRMTLDILGAKTKEELLENLPSVFREEGLSLMKEEIMAIWRGEDSFEGEGINYSLDGRRLHVHVRWISVPERNSFERVLLSVQDITERKNMEDRLRALSLQDPLTDVNNRTFFDEQIRRLDSGLFDPLGLLFLDLDELKVANDLMGHHAGDELLDRTGALLRRVFRDTDILARIGGDEFAVLLPQCDYPGLKRSLQRLQEELDLENTKNSSPVPLSLSVGWAWREKGEVPISEMLIDADRRMYRQKRATEPQRIEHLRESMEERLSDDLSSSGIAKEDLLPVLQKLRKNLTR